MIIMYYATWRFPPRRRSISIIIILYNNIILANRVRIVHCISTVHNITYITILLLLLYTAGLRRLCRVVVSAKIL